MAAALSLALLGSAAHAQRSVTPTPLGRQAPPSRVVTVAPQSARQALNLTVPLGKSEVLRVDQAFADLAVGDAKIADVVALTDRSVYVLGKALGTTNLTIYAQNHQLIAVVNVVVTQDIAGLKAMLYELMPNERIEVRPANDSIILSGIVSSAGQAGRAVEVAQRFAPDKVVNMLQVSGTQQVMLAVKVAEMSRTVARDLGIKPSLTLGSNARFTFTTLDPLNTNAFAAGVVNWATGFLSLTALIDALEQKGVVKVLAEPNLIALSGDTANFLAGGEFPVPEVQSATTGVPTITVAFKPFGVSLAFTPTVVDGDLINLVVAPEVSQIDPTTSVVISGFSIPGISTRRATTTVELRDGQSLAIAGLLQSNLADQVRQLPGLGDLPVIGALARSSSFQRKETELVIIVTPSLIKPSTAGTLAAPTDNFVPPSTVDLFFKGRVEDPASGTPQSVRGVLGASTGGGLAGRYGYVIK